MAMPIADRWFDTHRYGDDVTLIWEPHVFPGVRCNMWHVRGRDRDLLLDSDMGMKSLRENVALVTEKPVLCVTSLTHFDHVGSHYECEERLVHPAEADILTVPDRENTVIERYVTEAIFDAYPDAEFDPAKYTIRPAPPTRLIDEGDVVDLGDRHFTVMHLPGHSPGSIVLWEAATGIMLSGDVIYDGERLDGLYHSNVENFVESMERLRSVPVKTVHGGHHDSFGHARFLELIDDYVAGRRKPGCPAESQPRS